MNFYKSIDFVAAKNNRNLNIYKNKQVDKRLNWR